MGSGNAPRRAPFRMGANLFPECSGRPARTESGPKQKAAGRGPCGNRTRDLSHPKRESYLYSRPTARSPGFEKIRNNILTQNVKAMSKKVCSGIAPRCGVRGAYPFTNCGGEFSLLRCRPEAVPLSLAPTTPGPTPARRWQPQL